METKTFEVHVPVQAKFSENIKRSTHIDHNYVVVVHGAMGICLTAEENTRKPQLGDRLMKGLCDQSLPQMGSLSSK